MSKLPVISGRDCITALQKAGFVISSQKGSHIKLRYGGIVVIVPNHKTLDRGTLKNILDQANLSIEEFLNLLR